MPFSSRAMHGALLLRGHSNGLGQKQDRGLEPVPVLAAREGRRGGLRIHDAKELAVRFGVLKAGERECLHFLFESGGSRNALDGAGFERLHVVVKHGLVDLRLGAEIEIDCAFGQAGFSGNLVDDAGRKPLARKNLAGGVEDRLAAI